MKANARMKPDQERADGVRDALAQLVEVLEERHPAFAGFLIVIAERRKSAGLLRKVLPVVVAVLTGKWD